MKEINVQRLQGFKIRLETIKKEADILATLMHSNIIKFYDSFSYNHHFYIITEYCNVICMFHLITTCV